MNFNEWLARDSDVAWDRLRQYAVAESAKLKGVDSLQAAASVIQQDAELGPDRRDALLRELSRAWEAYSNATKFGPTTLVNTASNPATGSEPFIQSVLRYVSANLHIILLSFLAAVAIVILAAILWPKSPLRADLGDTDVARGLVTFVFAFGVILVTLILLVSLLGSNRDNHDQAVARFNAGKELFTAMIAVFGTILGFYFGEASQGVNPAEGNISSEESTLLGMALLGLNVAGVDLTAAEVSLIGAVLSSDREPQEKTAAIEELLSSPLDGQTDPISSQPNPPTN